MAVDLKFAERILSEVRVREDRLGSFSFGDGTLDELYECGGCSGKNGGRCFSQNSGCMNGCAQGYLSAIDDAAVITHGVIGCSADFMGSNNARKWGEFAQGRPHIDNMTYSTNMNEKDTVFGASDKLRETVRAVYKDKHPAAIFISTTCVSGIIGEDVPSVAAELADELGIPVVPVGCEGFKTKIWATGFDAAFHALLYGICKPAAKKTNTINVVNFRGSATNELNELFSFLGYKPRLIAGYQSVEELSKMPEAAATVTICGTLGSYIGNGLESRFGVPYVKSMQPHGIAGFEDWLRQLGDVLGKRSEIESYITEKRGVYLPKINAVKNELSGTRAVVGMGPSFAFNFTRTLEEIGIIVDKTFAWHFDKQYDDGEQPASLRFVRKNKPALNISVNDLQYQYVIPELLRINPDIFFFRHPTNAGIIQKLGIPAFSIIDEYLGFGYEGLLKFAKQIKDVLINRNFERKLREHTRLPYTEEWLCASI